MVPVSSISRRGEADLAIRAGRISDQDLIARKLCDSGLSLYASKTYLERRPAPDNPNDLSGHEVIRYGASLSEAPAAWWLEEHSVAAVIVLRSREMTDVLSATLSGVGLAMLPCLLGDEELELTRLTPDVLVTQSLSPVYRRETSLAQPVRAAIRFVTIVMRQHAGRIGGTSHAQ